MAFIYKNFLTGRYEDDGFGIRGSDTEIKCVREISSLKYVNYGIGSKYEHAVGACDWHRPELIKEKVDQYKLEGGDDLTGKVKAINELYKKLKEKRKELCGECKISDLEEVKQLEVVNSSLKYFLETLFDQHEDVFKRNLNRYRLPPRFKMEMESVLIEKEVGVVSN